jgi:CCR4-NOT transcription complex subunit 4
MQKKQRKEAQKEKERSELEATATKAEPEVEIAPIMGRKKKQKKDRVLNTTTGDSTPTASRPQSPTPMESAAEETKPSADSLSRFLPSNHITK